MPLLTCNAAELTRLMLTCWDALNSLYRLQFKRGFLRYCSRTIRHGNGSSLVDSRLFNMQMITMKLKTAKPEAT